MKLGIQMVLAALLATSFAATLDAQQPDGQNRQRGQGGPGGRGGFTGGMFGGGGLLGLVQIPEVQKELKVTDDQKGLIDEMAKDLREGGARPNREELQNLTEEQRTARFAEMRKQFEERTKQADEGIKVALDEKQFARLNELRIQREGVIAALSRAEVAEQLKLSQDQKDKVAKISEANPPQFGGGFGGRGPGGGQPGQGGQRPAGQDGQRPDFQALMAEARAKREKANAEALAVLTPEQKTSFEKMQGAKFEFPAPQFGGGRGPGGQPGARPKAE